MTPTAGIGIGIGFGFGRDAAPTGRENGAPPGPTPPVLHLVADRETLS